MRPKNTIVRRSVFTVAAERIKIPYRRDCLLKITYTSKIGFFYRCDAFGVGILMGLRSELLDRVQKRRRNYNGLIGSGSDPHRIGNAGGKQLPLRLG